MGILDEAIREHLELKRQHGADEPELKQLEDEAFGPPERPGSEAAPDPLAEAPTEFLTQPEAGDEASTAEPQGEVAEETSPRQEAAARIADLQEAPQPAEAAEEEQPAAEHEAIAEPAPEEPVADEPAVAGPSTEERQVISEQPTEMFDVEQELAPSEPAPSEEELVEEEISGPRLAPVDPLAGLDEGGEIEVADETSAADDKEDDDFWDEKRLSDELDQALEGPFASEEDEVVEEDDAPPALEEGEEDADVQASKSHDEDVLEETPDFLEETPEDDELWFEQKPPKDFDFDD